MEEISASATYCGADRLVDARHRVEQGLRIGVLRPVEDVVDAAGLHDLALAHHQHLVGGGGDHAHVVGDHDDGGFELLLQVAHDVEDLRLHRYVERGRGVVGDEKVGAAHRRHRDHHALAHAAGKLMRILAHAVAGFGDAHEIEDLDRPLLRLAIGDALVDAQRLDDLCADGHVRRQRGQRVLEDGGDLGAAQPVQRLLGQAENFLAAEFHAAGGAPVGGEKSDRGKEKLALARARFAHHAEAFAFADVEARGLDGMDFAVMRGEAHVEIADLEDLRGHLSDPWDRGRRAGRRR